VFGGSRLTVALAFQVAVVVVAVGLAWLFGLAPWERLQWSAPALGWSVTATLPLLAMLLVFPVARWQWAREISRIVEQVVLPLFNRAPAGSVLLVALLAGVGEELLFRGVVQDGLAGLFGPVTGLILASLLFGLAHAVTPAYFIIASLLGAYLGWLYVHSGNLLIPIIVHALYDWIAIHFYLWNRKRGTRRSGDSGLKRDN